MIDSFSDRLKSKGFKLRENYNLRAETYIRIDTVARLVVYPKDESEFIYLLEALYQAEVPYRVLGRISNVLFRDGYYNGVVVKTDDINDITVSENVVTLGCGCFFPTAVKVIATYDLGGFEGLSGIPGSVGGMVKQNAGAFGYQISDRFIECSVYDVFRKDVCTLNRTDIRFDYRSSIVKDDRYIILSAKFMAENAREQDIRSEINKYAAIRRSTQPIGEPSLGSVFKQVDGIGAGYFIDKLGLKGVCHGGAMISTKHAGFIVNNGNARARDVISLMEYVRMRAESEFGIALEDEIEII